MTAIKVLSIITLAGSIWMILMGAVGWGDASLYQGISAWLILGALWSIAFAIVCLVVASHVKKQSKI